MNSLPVCMGGLAEMEIVASFADCPCLLLTKKGKEDQGARADISRKHTLKMKGTSQQTGKTQ